MSEATVICCYRVWFKDGSCLLVDAEDMAQAKTKAIALAREQGGETIIRGRIDNLDQPGEA